MEKKTEYIKIEAACAIESNYAIGMSKEANGIFKLDLETGASEYLTMVPEEGININRLYTTACYKNGMVYFTPFMANDIAIFDVDKNYVFKKHVKAVHGCNSKKKFSGVIEYGTYLFITPCQYPAVIRIDSITGEIDYYDDWLNGEQYLFRKAPVAVGSRFYLPSVNNDLLLEFDMENCKGLLHHIGVGHGFWSACYLDGELWLAPIHQESVIGWNTVTHKNSRIEQYPDGFVGQDFLFTKAYLSDGELFMIPAKANMAVKVDVYNKVISNANITELAGNTLTEFLIEMEGYIYLVASSDNGIRFLRIMKKNNEVEPFGFYLREDEFERYHNIFLENSAEQNEIIRENSLIGLKDLIGVFTI